MSNFPPHCSNPEEQLSEAEVINIKMWVDKILGDADIAIENLIRKSMGDDKYHEAYNLMRLHRDEDGEFDNLVLAPEEAAMERRLAIQAARDVLLAEPDSKEAEPGSEEGCDISNRVEGFITSQLGLTVLACLDSDDALALVGKFIWDERADNVFDTNKIISQYDQELGKVEDAISNLYANIARISPEAGLTITINKYDFEISFVDSIDSADQPRGVLVTTGQDGVYYNKQLVTTKRQVEGVLVVLRSIPMIIEILNQHIS